MPQNTLYHVHLHKNHKKERDNWDVVKEELETF